MHEKKRLCVKVSQPAPTLSSFLIGRTEGLVSVKFVPGDQKLQKVSLYSRGPRSVIFFMSLDICPYRMSFHS